MNDKIKVLFLSSCPDRLRGDRELRDIQEKIRSAPYGDAFEIAAAWAVRTRDVQDILRQQKAQIVHFSGHGTEAGGIFLESDYGGPVAVSARAMRGLFEPLRGITRVVILNACETRPLAEALIDLVDYAIVMRRAITDRAAIVFATELYGALAHGTTVPGAFNSAVTRLCMGETIPESDIPDLVSRHQGTAGPLLPEPRRERPVKPRREKPPQQRVEGAVVTVTGNGNTTTTNVNRKG